MFLIAFQNVLLTLAYIVPGFVLCKVKKAAADHLSTLSAVLVYVCSPCMIISSFLQIDFTVKGFADMAIFFGVTFVLQAVFMLAIYLIFRKKYHLSKYRMLTIGSVMGNVGFFGLPIVKAMLPNNPEVMCYSAVYVVSMNILVFTVGIFCLTGDKKYMSIKNAFINPTVISFVIALPLYFFRVGNYLPTIVSSAVNLLGNMTTPMCMIILGIRLATVSLVKLFTRPFMYVICACKLIIFPLFCYAAVYFLPLAYSFKASVMILSAAPCASVILNMAEMYHAEEELAANCVLVSTLFCFLTIPLLALIL
jgi:predicted permease